MKTNKNIKSSTRVVKQSKEARYAQTDASMHYSFRQTPISQAYLEELADKLVDWIETDKEALVFEEFLHKSKITWSAWGRWRKKNEKLNEAHSYALMCIGIRRELGGLRRKLDPSIVMRSMPHYSESWQALNEWYARIKEAESNTKTNIVVEMVQTPKLEG